MYFSQASTEILIQLSSTESSAFLNCVGNESDVGMCTLLLDQHCTNDDVIAVSCHDGHGNTGQFSTFLFIER